MQFNRKWGRQDIKNLLDLHLSTVIESFKCKHRPPLFPSPWGAFQLAKISAPTVGRTAANCCHFAPGIPSCCYDINVVA